MTHSVSDSKELPGLVQLVEDLARHVESTDDTYSANYRRGVECYPIPFFGDLLTAEVITIGLNPSAEEFAPARSWPRGLSSHALTDRLLNYFHGNSHPWFSRWERGLSAIGASYARNAAHIDITPRATVSAATVPDRLLLEKTAAADLAWMLRFLAQAKHVKLLLVAGSIHRGMYLNEFLGRYLPLNAAHLEGSLDRPRREKGFVRYYTFRDAALRLPMFFCSSGPSNRNNPQLIGERVVQESHALRELLSTRKGY